MYDKNGIIDHAEAAQARAAVDIAHPFQLVEFAPRLDAAGLRRLARVVLAASAGPAAVGLDDALASLANAIHTAAERDAAGHGAALAELAAASKAQEASP